VVLVPVFVGVLVEDSKSSRAVTSHVGGVLRTVTVVVAVLVACALDTYPPEGISISIARAKTPTTASSVVNDIFPAANCVIHMTK
jgi:hypothetical protein